MTQQASARGTVLLTSSDVRHLLEPAALLRALKDGFTACQQSPTATSGRMPFAVPLAAQGGSGIVLAPGLIPGIPAYSVKVHAKFPAAMPAIRGLVLLHSLEDGALLAVIESSFLTAMRTGLAGALAADVLARPDAATVAIIGAGAQGVLQLECLTHVRHLQSVRVFDVDAARAATFAREQSARLALAVETAHDVASAVADADIIITATWARAPFLSSAMVKPGCHITTLGPDQPGKAELTAELIERSTFIADDAGLAVAMGAIGGVGLSAAAIDGELGAVLAGTCHGRQNEQQITVFGAVGLPFQDLAAGWLVYQRALKMQSGQRLDFFA